MVDNSVSNKDFFVVSPKKLGKLFIFTFGIYGVYWFYKNWALQQKYDSQDTIPVLRGLFNFFFAHSLFRRVENSLTLNKVDFQFKANLMATVYIVFGVAANIVSMLIDKSDPPPVYSGALFVVMVLLMVYPLQEAQEAVNHLVNDPEGQQNSRYQWWQVVVIALGALVWFSIIVSPIIIAIVGVEAVK